jgi:hypothetical protein
VRGYYEDKLELLGDGPNTPIKHNTDDLPAESPIVKQEHVLWYELLIQEQKAIHDLRKGFHIGDDVMHELLREIDALASRFK